MKLLLLTPLLQPLSLLLLRLPSLLLQKRLRLIKLLLMPLRLRPTAAAPRLRLMLQSSNC
jgi:hypothetical protein